MSDPLTTERAGLRDLILARSSAAVRGDGDILDHARQIYRAWRRLGILQNPEADQIWYTDEDRTFLVYVESELDRFPLGEERNLWATDAIAELEREMEGMRRDWGPRLVAIFQTLPDEMKRLHEAGALE